MLTRADDNKKEQRKEPYIYCNVTLADACFGIAPGDELTMKIVIDFLLYRVTFASGREAVIYYGFHPNPSEERGENFNKCPDPNGFSSCKKRALSNGGLEFIATRDDKSESVHVVISGGSTGQEGISSFLRNIRACRNVDTTITCAP